jgi:hypothetical protein
MTLPELLLLAIPAAAIVAFRYSSVGWVKGLYWVPAIQLLLLAALIFIDSQCQGNGFNMAWFSCGNRFLDQHANSIAGPLYVNMFLIAALPLGIMVLVVAEVILRKKRQLKIR